MEKRACNSKFGPIGTEFVYQDGQLSHNGVLLDLPGSLNRLLKRFLLKPDAFLSAEVITSIVDSTQKSRQEAASYIYHLRELLKCAHPKNPIVNERNVGWKFNWTVTDIETLPSEDLLQPALPAVAALQGILRPLESTTGMLPRTAAVEKLKKALLRDSQGKPHLTVLVGMPGIGKTKIASLVMEDLAVKARFPDGIVALKVGLNPSPGHLQSLISDIPNAFGESSEGWTYHSAFHRLSQLLLLKGTRTLFVLDNVWHAKDIGWMGPLPEGSAVLMTTRALPPLNISIHNAEIVKADSLDDGEARTLLALEAGIDASVPLPAAATYILNRCRGLAFAIAVVGRILRRHATWEHVAKLFEDDRLNEMVDWRDSVYTILDISVNDLPAVHLEKYLQCAVFPDDVEVPEAVLGTLWADKIYTVTLGYLHESMLLRWEDGRVTFHNLQLAYLRQRAAARHATLHDQFLTHYLALCDGGNWPNGPDDGYYFQFLPFHLHAADRRQESDNLLDSLAWLENKLVAAGMTALLADFPSRHPLANVLRQAAHIIVDDSKALAPQLLARVRSNAGPIQLLAECRLRQGWQPQWCSLESDPALEQTLEGHFSRVECLAVAGEELVTGSDDGAIRIWSLATGQARLTLSVDGGHVEHHKVASLVVKGEHLVAGLSDGTIKMWSLPSGKPIYDGKIAGGGITTLAIHGNDIFAGSEDGNIYVWSANTPVDTRVLGTHTRGISCLAMAGSVLISGSDDGALRRWNLSDETSIPLGGHTGRITSIAVPGDGTVLSGSFDRTIRIYDINTGLLLRSYDFPREEANPGSVRRFPFDGDSLVVTGYGRAIWLVHCHSGRLLRILEGHSRGLKRVLVTPKHVVSGGADNTIRIWNREFPAFEHATEWHTAGVRSVAFAGDRLISGSYDTTIKVWDCSTGEVQKSISTPNLVRSVAAAGSELFEGSYDKTVRVRNIETGQLREEFGGHAEWTIAVPFGDHIVSGSYDHTVRIWKRGNPEPHLVLKGHTRGVSCLAVFDNEVVSGSYDRTIRTWSLTSGEPRLILGDGFGKVRSIAVNSDVIVAGYYTETEAGQPDNSIRIWCRRFGTMIRELKGHTHGVRGVAIVGDKIVSGSSDRSIRVWALNSGDHLYTFRVDALIRCVAAQGKLIAAGDDAGRVHLLRHTDL